MTQPLRIGVLGTGSIARRALFEPARDVSEIEVVAVASRDGERARGFARAHGIPRSSGYAELLADPDVDVIYITLPPSLHAEWSIRAMEAGKDVLCEKPLASDAAEAEAIDEAALHTGRVFVEAYHYHHHPLARRVREIVASGVLGTIEHARARFHIPRRLVEPGNIRLDPDLGGGALLDAGCYGVHALRHLLGEPTAVLDATATVGNDRRLDLGIGVRFAFNSGAVGEVEASFLAGDDADIGLIVRGTRGSLEVPAFWVPQWGAELRGNWDGHEFQEDVDSTPTFEFQLRELVRSVRHGAPVLTNARDGVATMALIDECRRRAGLA